jgi:hypothetical protein
MVISSMPNCRPQGRFVSHSARSAFRLRSPDIIVHATATLTDESTLSKALRTSDLPRGNKGIIAVPTTRRRRIRGRFRKLIWPVEISAPGRPSLPADE